VARSAGSEHFLFDDAVAVRRDAREPVFGLAVALRSRAEAAAVRAGADPGIVAVAPIGEVVAALRRRAAWFEIS
jgi:hypothetical protein